LWYIKKNVKKKKMCKKAEGMKFPAVHGVLS